METCLHAVRPKVEKIPNNRSQTPKTYFNDHLGLSVGIQKQFGVEFQGLTSAKATENPFVKGFEYSNR